MKKHVLIFLALTVAAAGCTDTSTQPDNPTNSSNKADFTSLERHNVIDGYNITINQTVKGNPRLEYVIEDSIHYGEYQKIVIRSGSPQQILSRCNNAVQFSADSLSNPCPELRERMKR